MGIGTLAGLMSEDWLLVCQFKYLGNLDVGFVPLEDKEATGS